jgi:hypothetical protein
LLPGHIELFHNFFNCHPIFKVFENRSYRKTGAAKDPCPADLSRDTLNRRAF